MTNWNNRLLYRRRTTKLGKLNNCVRIAWMKLQSLPPPVKGGFWLTLAVLVIYGGKNRRPPASLGKL